MLQPFLKGYRPLDARYEHLFNSYYQTHAPFERSRRGLLSRPTVSEVYALYADFSQPLALPAETLGECPLASFPGSSIGNFDPVQARAFLRNLHAALPPGSGR